MQKTLDRKIFVSQDMRSEKVYCTIDSGSGNCALITENMTARDNNAEVYPKISTLVNIKRYTQKDT